jgi:phospholipid-binding lipoprotein MlaA
MAMQITMTAVGKNREILRCGFLLCLALAVCGCAAGGRNSSPEAKNLNISSKAGTAEPNSDSTKSDDEDFGLIEGELAEKRAQVPDPFEGINRVMFGFNDVFYFWIMKPVAQTWKAVIPAPGRTGISNFFSNLFTPIRLANCLLQGKNEGAGRELNRFLINTTVGVLGIGDPALDKYGIKRADEDLGQTLAVYGLGDGFYLVLPLLGPSTLRDAAGDFGDSFLNPVYYVKPTEVYIGITAGKVVNNFSFHIGEYESFKAASIDAYIMLRSAYIQYRRNQIKDQPVPATMLEKQSTSLK